MPSERCFAARREPGAGAARSCSKLRRFICSPERGNRKVTRSDCAAGLALPHSSGFTIRDNNFRNRLVLRELPEIAAQLKADVVHSAIPAPVREGAYKCPSRASLHDLYPFDIPATSEFEKSNLPARLCGNACTTVDAIACVSDFTRSAARVNGSRRIVSRKAVTIPNSVEPGCVGPARPPTAARRDSHFVLCVAQHRQNKNIPLA